MVDDESDMLAVMMTVLTRKGYQAFGATSGADAIVVNDKENPDLILLDLNLPKISGYQILSIIKSEDSLRKIPVVVLSISSSEKDIEESYNLSANCYVTKPLDLNEFIDVFERIQSFWLRTVKLPA